MASSEGFGSCLDVHNSCIYTMTHALTSAMTTEAGYDWTAISPKVAILGRHFLLATSVATETVLDRPRSWLASKQTIKQGST